MELLKEMGPVSVSRLQKFERCPYEWYQRYVLGAEEPVGEPAEFGKLIHAIVAEAINQKTDPDYLDDLLIDIMSGELNKEDDQIDELWFKFSAHRINEIIDMVKKALSMIETEGKAECHFCLPLPGGADIQGYIDYIDDVSVIDWKTGGNVKGALSSKQIAIYKWAAAQLKSRPPETYEGKYIFLGQDDGVYTDNYPIDKALDWAVNLCKKINDCLEAYQIFGEQVFEKKPGPACKWCGFPNECGKQLEGFIIPQEISNREEAREVAVFILQLESQLDRAKAAMKEFCKYNGPVELNGEWFAMFPGSPKKEWNKPALYNLLKNYVDTDDDWLKVFNVDTKAITALLKKQPDLEQSVNKLVKEKPGSKTFKHQQTAPAV